MTDPLHAAARRHCAATATTPHPLNAADLGADVAARCIAETAAAGAARARDRARDLRRHGEAPATVAYHQGRAAALEHLAHVLRLEPGPARAAALAELGTPAPMFGGPPHELDYDHGRADQLRDDASHGIGLT